MARSIVLRSGTHLGNARLTSGCFWGLTTQGPSLGILAIPIPVSPYFQDQKEDEYWEHERYERVPILGPITSGGPPVALDPPSDDEVMRALEKVHPVEGGIPLHVGTQPQQRADRQVQDCRLRRSAARLSAHRPGTAASRPLQVHRLLRRRPPHRLARAAHASRRRGRRSHLHRP